MSGPFYSIGNYVCRVTQQGFGESKNGNPMILLGMQPTSRITQAPDGVEELEACDQHYDRTVRLVISTDDQKEYAMLKLRNAGFQGDSFAQLNLEGADVRCECKHDKGTGENADKMYEQWDLQLPPRERTPMQPLDKNAARKLDAMFGKRLKDGAVKPEPVAAVSNGAGQNREDDVPF